ncbi:MAG: hypothetical protein H6658_14710 [Ardenticatenaceae bacterium]|nr:hypothetical protein [Ardenticatenaceae bacterium]
MNLSANLATFWRTLEGELVYQYHWLTMKTARWQVEGAANLQAARENGRPILFALWHGQIALLFMYGHRFFEPAKFTLVAVGDERHDILGRLGSRIGVKTHAVDMQGNPVAAGRATLRVIKAMKEGHDSLIAPDGPDGPAYQPKPGVIYLAQKAEAIILPLGIWTRQAYQRQRWDHYLVPYPFAQCHMVFGTPILAHKDDDSEALMTQVTAVLHAARTRAQQLAGITPWR